MRGFHNQRQRARPEFVREKSETRRALRASSVTACSIELTRIGSAFVSGRPFTWNTRFDGGEVEWIGGKAVESVRGDADYFAALDESGGVVHHVTFPALLVKIFLELRRAMFTRGVAP